MQEKRRRRDRLYIEGKKSRGRGENKERNGREAGGTGEKGQTTYGRGEESRNKKGRRGREIDKEV